MFEQETRISNSAACSVCTTSQFTLMVNADNFLGYYCRHEDQAREFRLSGHADKINWLTSVNSNMQVEYSHQKIRVPGQRWCRAKLIMELVRE
jgi:hypothetical protein